MKKKNDLTNRYKCRRQKKSNQNQSTSQNHDISSSTFWCNEFSIHNIEFKFVAFEQNLFEKNTNLNDLTWNESILIKYYHKTRHSNNNKKIKLKHKIRIFIAISSYWQFFKIFQKFCKINWKNILFMNTKRAKRFYNFNILQIDLNRSAPLNKLIFNKNLMSR